MLRIRLTRVGKKKKPAYRIVVADSRSPRDGSFLKIIGHYNPLADPATLVVKEDEAVHWLEKGAKPSDTAAKLLTRIGVMERAGRAPVRFEGKEVAPKPKKEATAPAAAPPAEAKAKARAKPPAEEEAPEAVAEAEAAPAQAEAPEIAEASPESEESSPAEEATDEAEDSAVQEPEAEESEAETETETEPGSHERRAKPGTS